MSEVRALPGELRFLARNEPVNQLTQKAESERSRLFAFLDPFSRVCDDSGREARVLVPQRLLSDPQRELRKVGRGSAVSRVVSERF